ncbi:hypothetical protein BKP45_10220 [Anaerobacillus alkalidiazotrophicus]|uniref:VanZ-like domain-containing protein n=1 Tax=Anaerobacillus alkalidiazotrophicus TaxID=472963 RepID=A0A1S2M5X5_9BACI|nr:hypothetical protein BKP45_10220 [Anaerobacillus alkalidiazotrophicus]
MIDQQFFHLYATLLLVLFVVYDLIRNRSKERSLLKRFVFYSFIYYMINVINEAISNSNDDYAFSSFSSISSFPFFVRFP